MQVGKKLLWLLFLCAVLTIGTGAMTGGWFGSGLRDLALMWKINWLVSFIDKITWFNPLQDPTKFIIISIALGYLQIMTGLFIGFVDNLMRKEFAAAICDKLTWLVWVNSLMLWGAGKMGAIPASLGSIALWIAIVPAIIILLFSQREGPISTRLAMGVYQLFSTVFYLGDILSYLRLMALGIASGGVAMAINIIAKTVSEVPYIGIVLAIVLLILGHTFNAVMSGLGSFVHSLRLQFVEYFPKFFVGGGREFTPLSKHYKYVYINADKAEK
jgi:V/A-type H+-transporting ATPase subunit I